MRKKLFLILVIISVALYNIPVSNGENDTSTQSLPSGYEENKIPTKPLTTTSQITEVILSDYGLPMTVLNAAKHQNKFDNYTYAEAEVAIKSAIIPYETDATSDGVEKPMEIINGPNVTAKEYIDSQSKLTVKEMDSFFGIIQKEILDHSVKNKNAKKYFINITVESVYRQMMSDGEIITFYGADGYYVVIDNKGILLQQVASFLDAENGAVYISNKKAENNFICGKSFVGQINKQKVSVKKGTIKQITDFTDNDLIAVIPYWSNNKLGEYYANGKVLDEAIKTVFNAKFTANSIGSRFTTDETTTRETINKETTTKDTTTISTTTKEATVALTTALTTAVETELSKVVVEVPDNTLRNETEEITESTVMDDTDTLLEQLSKYSGDNRTNPEPEALGAALIADNNSNDNNDNNQDGGEEVEDINLESLTTSNGEEQSFFDKAVGQTDFNVSNIMMFLVPFALITIGTALAISNKFVNKGDKEFIR